MSLIKDIIDVGVAVGTGALAFATFKLARYTKGVLQEAKDASFCQIGVQTWLELKKQFDSPELVRARKKLAQQLKGKPPASYKAMSQTVMNFFEDVGIAHRLKFLDDDLARSTFGLYATHYWEALKPFVAEDRRRYGADATFWEDFSELAKQLQEPGEKIDDQQLQKFLNDEADPRAD